MRRRCRIGRNDEEDATLEAGVHQERTGTSWGPAPAMGARLGAFRATIPCLPRRSTLRCQPRSESGAGLACVRTPPGVGRVRTGMLGIGVCPPRRRGRNQT
jgi:hypothetical protein